MSCQTDDDSRQYHDARTDDLSDRKSHTVGKIQFFMTFPHTFSSLFLPIYSRFCWRIPTEMHNILFFYSTEISSFVNLQNAQGLTLYLYRIDNIIIELVSL